MVYYVGLREGCLGGRSVWPWTGQHYPKRPDPATARGAASCAGCQCSAAHHNSKLLASSSHMCGRNVLLTTTSPCFPQAAPGGHPVPEAPRFSGGQQHLAHIKTNARAYAPFGCRPRLAGTMFQKDLGSLLDKSARVEALVPSLAAAAGLEGAAGRWQLGAGWILEGQSAGGLTPVLMPCTPCTALHCTPLPL